VASHFDRAVEAFGRVDILVANAGAQKDAGIADMTLEDWRQVIELDLTASSSAVARRYGGSGYRTVPAGPSELPAPSSR
jgi:glucose 1-dehydrogenase